MAHFFKVTAFLFAFGCESPKAPEYPSTVSGTKDVTGAEAAEANAKPATPVPDSPKKATAEVGAGGVTPALAEQVKLCEAKGRYFDIAKVVCTPRLLATEFNCNLIELTSAESKILGDKQKIDIKNYFARELKGYVLTACVDDGDVYTLVATKQEAATNKIFLQTLTIPKK